MNSFKDNFQIEHTSQLVKQHFEYLGQEPIFTWKVKASKGGDHRRLGRVGDGRHSPF